MVVRQATKRDMRVKAKILQGRSRHEVARLLGIPETTVRRTVTKLVALNELRPVPGTANPVIYEDPRTPATFGTGPANEKTLQNVTYVQNKRIPIEAHGPEEVNIHLKGFVRFVVHKVGNYDIVRDIQKNIMAQWGDTKFSKGRVDRHGSLYAFGEVFKFAHRHGNQGSETIAFWPQGVWVHEKDKASGREMLIDRAKYLAQLLKPYGWVLSDPEIRGKIHYARQNQAMIELYQKVTPSDDTEAEVDTSPEVPEFETYEDEHDDLMNHLPSNIIAMKADIANNATAIMNVDNAERALREENRALRMEILRVENFLLERDLTNKEILYRNIADPIEATKPNQQPASIRGLYG